MPEVPQLINKSRRVWFQGACSCLCTRVPPKDQTHGQGLKWLEISHLSPVKSVQWYHIFSFYQNASIIKAKFQYLFLASLRSHNLCIKHLVKTCKSSPSSPRWDFVIQTCITEMRAQTSIFHRCYLCMSVLAPSLFFLQSDYIWPLECAFITRML